VFVIVAVLQIGFTAEATEGRSSTYSSDIAKIIRAPVFHVNAENVSHVLKAATLAVKYRQTFGRDILLDITGYRRHGHNEVDEPSFTQPKMYKAIRARPSSTQLFGDALQARGVITKEWREGLAAKLHAHLDKEFTAASEVRPHVH
jgi:2-oxoglutarate dehydrogenase complex dehydrogenase (E1) component-like enzyme